MRGLYVHIPFCRSKCAYCDFLSFESKTDEEISRYVRCLVREMSLFQGERYSTVYVGGGTPSFLRPAELEPILSAVNSIFELERGAEFTVETNPESLSEGHLGLFKANGVNRVSLGVQSFDDGALTMVGRVARKEDNLRALRLVRQAGFENFNIDMIQGIQARAAFRSDIEAAAFFAPSHISVYMLSLSDHTRLAGMAEEGTFSPAGDEESEELYEHTGEFLSRHGYAQYEVSNYAKRGFESRHNVNYWSGGEYRGVGLGAVSTIAAERRTNERTLDAYCRMIEEGKAPVHEIEKLTFKVRLLERIMLSLRMSSGVLKEELMLLAVEKKRNTLSELYSTLEQNGYTIPDERRLVLSRRGLFRSNAIIAELWSALS